MTGEELVAPAATTWNRLTPGTTVTQDLLTQITAQAAAAAASATAAQASAVSALAGASSATQSALIAEMAAAAAQTSAANAALQAIAAAASAAAAALSAAAAGVGKSNVSTDTQAAQVVDIIRFHRPLDAIIVPGAIDVYQRTPLRTSGVLASANLVEGQTGVGAAGIGRCGVIYRLTASHRCWLRVYGSVADRDADAGRLMTVDPISDAHIQLEVIFDTSLAVQTIMPVWYQNQDTGDNPYVYYSLKRLDPTPAGSALVTVNAFFHWIGDSTP